MNQQQLEMHKVLCRAGYRQVHAKSTKFKTMNSLDHLPHYERRGHHVFVNNEGITFQPKRFQK